MVKLIDKDALVAEIDKLKDEALEYEDKSRWFLAAALKKRIDTLEVKKEVDFEKYYHDFLQKEWYNSHVRTVSEMMAFTAKHFYELGLSVSNESQKEK